VQSSLYQGREYSLAVPSGHFVFAPWHGTDQIFEGILAEATRGGEMVVDRERCYTLYQFIQYALEVRGEFAECGTYKGGTAQLIAATIQKLAPAKAPAVHLFDTFSGMPEFAVPKRDHHRPGDHADTSLDYVKERLQRYPNIRYHPGLMPATFAEIPDGALFAFVHVDTDIYPSVRSCCETLWPRLAPGGVMLFDDYGFRSYRNAARAAVDEYFRSPTGRPIVMSTGQAFVVKPPR
jgi:O-methyltransferase